MSELSTGIVLDITGGTALWRQYVESVVRRTMAAYEKVLGLSAEQAMETYGCLKKGSSLVIRIVAQEQVLLNGAWIGAYNNLSGFYGEDRGIFVEPQLSPVGNPALMMHELGHFWFWSPPWCCEGMVSYLPLVLAESGLFDLNKEERRAILEHWGFNWVDFDDQPTIDDFRAQGPGAVRAWYAKTFKIQHLLRTELGDKAYLAFAKDLACKRKRLSTDDILSILTSLKKRDWKSILSGWVFAGEYKGTSMKDLTDRWATGKMV